MRVREKIDTLQEVVALLAKSIAGRETLTPRKRGRKNRHRHVAEESSDDKSASSEEEEEEPTPPPKANQKPRRRNARRKKSQR